MLKNFIVVLLILSLTGCSRQHYKHEYSNSSSDEFKISPINYNTFESTSKNNKANFDTRKIIYNAAITIVVKNPDTVNNQLVEIAKKYEGYIQTSSNTRTIIRVKANNLNNALLSISKLGKVQQKSIESEDISDHYNDLQIKLDNAEKTRKRYQDLLHKAENVTEVLNIEKELERLNETINLVKGKLKRYEHLTSYSTISVEVKEKIKPGLFGYIGIGLYHSFKWLFVRN